LQHGMIHRDQLLAAGLDRNAIAYRVQIGRLHLRHRGVYAVGHVPPSPHARAMAAVLACGPDARLSHQAAGALWAFGLRWPEIIDVTARTKRRHKGIRVHRSRTLTPQDVTVHFGIPVTTPARTLLDLAEVLDTPSLTRAVNEARLAHRVTLTELAELIDRSPGRATKRLRPLVERGDQPTRSRFEDEFLEAVDRRGIPRPEANQVIAGYEVDMLWREHRLVVELDGRDSHEHTFEQDRERDAALLNAGFPVLRITWRRFREQRARELDRLAATLDQRSTAAGPAA
jgi:very-short-patch-repair endonuclease